LQFLDSLVNRVQLALQRLSLRLQRIGHLLRCRRWRRPPSWRVSIARPARHACGVVHMAPPAPSPPSTATAAPPAHAEPASKRRVRVPRTVVARAIPSRAPCHRPHTRRSCSISCWHVVSPPNRMLDITYQWQTRSHIEIAIHHRPRPRPRPPPLRPIPLPKGLRPARAPAGKMPADRPNRDRKGMRNRGSPARWGRAHMPLPPPVIGPAPAGPVPSKPGIPLTSFYWHISRSTRCRVTASSIDCSIAHYM
jgi:hypothetical protein